MNSAAAINKRSEARKGVNGRGRIVFADKIAFLECTILDASPSGAHIRLGRKTALPSQFYLLNIRNRTVHTATIAWSNAEHAGLRFTESYVLGSELPTDFDFMRKHWLECATR
ncbi:MAG: PilZ domain-containing protein [Alphaproteobacteria bacterium]|nr:PilZ domain-containing protein [Alphaproteobacteria bacterium]